MAIVQHSNGFIDQIRPRAAIFSDLELIDIFLEADKIRSRRLLEIPNTWCIWGENEEDEIEETDFNALGSKVVEEEIFSKLLIIHDSELDPEWNLTDKTIINTYNDFREIAFDFIDAVAMEVIKEKMEADIPFNEGNKNSEGPVLPRLENLGNTEDKKVLMEFKPVAQVDKFWDFTNFTNFAQRSFEYLHGFFDQNLGLKSNAFVIYADKKGIIVVKDKNVDTFMEKMLDNFEQREKYHGCSNIIAIVKKWRDYVKAKKEPMKGKWSDYMEKKNESK